MKTLTIILFFAIASILGANSTYASLLPDSKESYAQEYKKLRILLENVKDSETALHLKPAIEKQVKYLNENQQSGAENFNAMTSEEKKFFIKKFQNNRFHCGEVTQVMSEKQRILLQPDLANILRETLQYTP